MPGELCAQVDHADGKVCVIEDQVVGDGPHDDEVDVLVAQLPGDGARGARDGVELVDGHHDFTVGREDLAFVEAVLEVAILGVHHGEREHPLGPVLDADDAAHIVALVVPGHVF